MMEPGKSWRLTAGQAARFERLVVPQLAVLLRAARILTHDDQQAEDLVQNAVMKAMRAIDRFRDGTDIKSWLLTILRRTHIDAVRSSRHRPRAVSIDQTGMELSERRRDEGGEHDSEWTEPAALLERFGDREVIEALQGLPEDIRWTLLLVDVEQMDHSEAAAVLEVPVGTIKSRAHRGRAMLRDRLYRWAQEHGWLSQQKSSHARQSNADRA